MDYIKSLDLFPAQIGLTMQGRTSYKTKFGGWYSIFILLFSLVYAIIIILEPLKTNKYAEINSFEIGATEGIASISAGSKINETVTINGIDFEGTNEVKKYTNYIKNFTFNDSYSFTPHQEGFQFALRVPDDFNGTTYAIKMHHAIVINNSFHLEDLDHDKCNISDFPQEVHNELNLLPFKNYICPIRNNISYSGSVLGYNSHSIVVDIELCIGNVSCQPDAKNKTYGTLVNFVYVDSVYDYNNITNRIKHRVSFEISIL